MLVDHAPAAQDEQEVAPTTENHVPEAQLKHELEDT